MLGERTREGGRGRTGGQQPGGGLIALTTAERLRAAGGVEVSYAEAMNVCLLQQLIARRGWPA
ncbi:hypothetical protein ACFV1N_25320 [Streptosporangium canum]|uniref:hypothetical protein n=1 Tax=Streptosporangium canum TaxID=324952 RepID=UPI0036A91C42